MLNVAPRVFVVEARWEAFRLNQMAKVRHKLKWELKNALF